MQFVLLSLFKRRSSNKNSACMGPASCTANSHSHISYTIPDKKLKGQVFHIKPVIYVQFR